MISVSAEWFEGRYERHQTGCWLWMGALNDDGYGRIYRREGGKQKRITTHRAMFMAVHGNIPDGLSVLHTCDTPRCINPAHLYAGTQLQNIKDRVERGHSNSQKMIGALNPNSKLTAAEVMEIRQSTLPMRFLVARFGIGRSQISRIKTLQSWRLP